MKLEANIWEDDYMGSNMMKAAQYYGVGDIRLEKISIPEIGDHEILVKVKACAICGTDLRIYKFGHFKIPGGCPHSRA